jgi:hypothetical protein
VTRRARLALVLAGALAAAGVAAAGFAVAQPTNSTGTASEAGGQPVPPGVPVIQPPPETSPPPAATAPANSADEAPTNAVHARPPPPKPPGPPPPPPAPPKPVRSPTAVMQALDKVTAETMRFTAPVGQPIRYKNLVFVVKSCETRDAGQASPRTEAYVVIDFAPLGAEGVAPPPAKRVFKGWMFANSPGLNPFQHPIYDAWLISCTAAAPAA